MWWKDIKPSQGKIGTIVICCGDNSNDSTFTHDSIGQSIHSREIQWYFMKRFSKLNNLLKDGVLTQEEFDKAKQKLLDN